MGKASIFLILLLLAIAESGLAGTINVTTYGATGNGSTDDTAAINRAVAAIPSTGATLYFPCGTYIVSSTIGPIYTSNTTVTGPAVNPTCVTLKATGTRNFEVLTVTGQGLTGSTLLAANAALGSNKFTVVAGGLAALGIQAGSYVLVSDLPTGPGTPPISHQQLVRVISTAGDVATFDGTFAQAFTLAAGSYVQNISTPIIGARVLYLAIDGGTNVGTSTSGLTLAMAANCEVAHVSVANVLGPGINIDMGYGNNLHELTVTSSGSKLGDAMQLSRQTVATVQNVLINNSVGHGFGFSIRKVHMSTLSYITANQHGSIGRAFKTQRSSYNLLTNIIATGAGGGHNGISVTDQSTHNTFVNCQGLSNTGNGISTFGTGNSNNSFISCQAKYNTAQQFYQVPGTDDNTTVIGGVFCCGRVAALDIFVIKDNNFHLENASIYDDQHLAIAGLVVYGARPAIFGNTFSGLPATTDIYIRSGDGIYGSNKTPDGIDKGSDPTNIFLP
ncbi:MAG TPA: glycosyl hydrolase family 28-related protein [Terriglobales bacterium]|nr:glycosyl hydrolase family 28-related protein [Terriglobales bacterium]